MVDDVDTAIQRRPPPRVELQLALNLIPAHAWYALPSGALTFVNERTADCRSRYVGFNARRICDPFHFPQIASGWLAIPIDMDLNFIPGGGDLGLTSEMSTGSAAPLAFERPSPQEFWCEVSL